MFIFFSGIIFFLVLMVLSVLVLGGIFLNSLKNFLGHREVSSGFECGFDGKSLSRVPFSLRFFLVLILFLIFDVEIILVLQFPFLTLSGKFIYMLSLKLFLIVLLLGAIEEWRRGFLVWVCE